MHSSQDNSRDPSLLRFSPVHPVEADSLSPHMVGLRLAELLPNSRLVVFECADHWVARINAQSVAIEIDRLVRGEDDSVKPPLSHGS